MKLSKMCALATSGILLIGSTVSIVRAADVDSDSLTFIRSILNASPKDVERHLGKPDNGIKAAKDCADLPSCNEATYRRGKFEVLFYNNRLKWIVIKGDNLFAKNGLEVIGFSSAPPTVENKFIRSWRSEANKGTATGPLIPINGINEINVFPPNKLNNNAGFMLITIGVSYDKSFVK